MHSMLMKGDEVKETTSPQRITDGVELRCATVMTGGGYDEAGFTATSGVDLSNMYRREFDKITAGVELHRRPEDEELEKAAFASTIQFGNDWVRVFGTEAVVTC